jgi:hypothetical protein
MIPARATIVANPIMIPGRIRRLAGLSFVLGLLAAVSFEQLLSDIL